MGIILMILVWILLGCICQEPLYDCLPEDINPLWKIPLCFLGPLSIVGLFVIFIWLAISDYIGEVKAYYDRKRERKREEKLRHSYDDRIPERVIRELNRRD